jgi:polyferredoxin
MAISHLHAKREAPAEGCDPAAAEADDYVSDYRENYVPKEFFPEPPNMSYIDDAALALFLILGTLMAFGKIKPSKKARLIVPAAALLYFGVVRGGCVCPVGALANICLGFRSPELVGTAVAVLFLLPLFAALVAGRVFCSFGCPIGAVQDLLTKKRFIHLPPWTRHISVATTLGVLAATAFLILSERHFFICALDPYKIIFHSGYATLSKEIAAMRGYVVEPGLVVAGTLTAWTVLLGVLLVGFWFPRPFCRFICPYGILLGIISVVAFKRRTINKSSCVHCGACKRQCPTGAIRIDRKTGEAKVSQLHCVQCGECEIACPKDAVE